MKLKLKIAVVIALLSLVANAGAGFVAVKKQQQITRLNQSLQTSNKANQELTQDKTKLEEEVKSVSEKLASTEQDLAKKLEELQKSQDDLKKTQTEIAAKKKEIDSLSGKIKNQESQLAANSSELDKLRSRPPLFLVENKSSATDSETAITQLKNVVEASFDEIKSLYGDAYLLNQVTVQLVDSLARPNVAGEITIQNSKEGIKYTIRIKKFSSGSFLDVTTIVHEIIHAFHGIAFLEPVAHEEGITVAATEEIVSVLVNRGVVPNFSTRYLRISPEREAQLEADPNFVIPASSDAFYSSDQTSDYYQMTGRAWQGLANGDRGFYKRFNEALYAKVHTGIDPRGQVVLDTIREVKGSVPTKKTFHPA
ncbi:hypothetical protein HYZ64_01970 [Candidatus Berkelbacteria bacterium]|nr:hypothetical protein [Candidatus Berkelbacteria bacterium]